MDQYPNTPPQNQNQNQNQNQTPMVGFIPYSGEFMSMLTQGNMSPNIPNQRQFPQTSSPIMQFPNIHQSFDPRTGTFVPNFNQPFQFNHNQNYQQPQNNEPQNNDQSESDQNVGGSFSQSIPLFSTQHPSLEPVQVEGSQPTKKKKATKKKKQTPMTAPQGKISILYFMSSYIYTLLYFLENVPLGLYIEIV